MKIDILTLFPEMFDILRTSIIGKAVENGIININTINIRDFSESKHKKVDDTPYRWWSRNGYKTRCSI